MVGAIRLLFESEQGWGRQRIMSATLTEFPPDTAHPGDKFEPQDVQRTTG